MRFMGYGFIGIGGVVGFYDVPVTAAAYLLFGEIFTVVQRAAEKKESSNLKKIFAIILLIIIGVVALLVMVIGGMLLGHVADYMNSGLGLVIRIAIALAGTFGVDRLRILYKKKIWLESAAVLFVRICSDSNMGGLLNSNLYILRIFIFGL